MVMNPSPIPEWLIRMRAVDPEKVIKYQKNIKEPIINSQSAFRFYSLPFFKNSIWEPQCLAERNGSSQF